MPGMAAAARNASKHLATWIACTWISAASMCACGAAPDASEATASTASAIYGGVRDDDAKQSQSVVAVKVGDGQQVELCSGSLVAPNVVLTARHCVSVNLTTTVSCDQSGASLNGPQLGADQPAASIHVMLGPTANLAGTAAANGKAIFHHAGTAICNADLALVVLDRDVTAAQPMRVRLSGGAKAGESVRAVGFGMNDQGAPIGTRFRKDAVSVLAIGSAVSASQTALGASEFELGESICEGDSGGPALSETTGAIVGIVSRGGQCTDDFGHVYTSLAAFADVFQQAFALAGGAPIDENASAPDAGSGAPADGGNTAGPAGGVTHYDGNVDLHSGKGAGCAASGAPSGRPPFAVLAVASLAVILRRRRLI